MRTGISASRDRWEKSDFVARLHRRCRLGHFLVDGDAQRLPLGERRLPGAPAGHQQRAHARDRSDRRRDIELLAGFAELLAQAREIEDLDFHRYSSEYGMNFTISPARIGWFAGLSTRPPPHAVAISTADSSVGSHSTPPPPSPFPPHTSPR